MLIEFYGKLPHKSEFISPTELSPIAQDLIAWIEQGQNHLGESMLHTYDDGLCAYFFMIDQPIVSSTITGMLFKSQDKKSRKYPFVVFHRCADGSDDRLILSGYRALFDELGFDIAKLSQGMNHAFLFDGFLNFLQQNTLPMGNAIWQKMGDEKRFITDKLNVILYRKLMMGDV
ncbi:MAG: type VI secretion system-associated protein TagF [Moraxella sp.]|nr:type VI secretion system-associated protein TagF [Moraxella sp.]